MKYRYKNFFWGLMLMLIGVLIIGRNLNLLYFDWYNFLKLWPVIFILWGISVLPIRDVFKIGLLVVVLGGATWFVLDAPYSGRAWPFGYRWNNTERYLGHNHWQSEARGEQSFNIPYNDTIQYAKLKMDAAAGRFYLQDTTNNLLDLHERGTRNPFKYILEQNENETKIDISARRPHVIFFGQDNRDVKLKLNLKPVWNIDLNAGASELDFDMSRYKVERFSIDGGAGSFKVTLGDLYPNTQFKLDAGASSIVIRVPEKSGCDLRLSSVLSDRHLEGFTKIGDQHYQTDNYDTAKNKIHLNIDAAVSSFTIIRY